MSADHQLNPNQLNVAFVWHMHQPDYKDHLSGHYQMPWVRFHTTKDYVDMALMLERYPALQQTFNMVPSLMRQIEDYATNPVDDPVSRITAKESWTEDDQWYMISRFFDASFSTMIQRSPRYEELFNLRNHSHDDNGSQIKAFTHQDYEDLAALFNLVWFDPMWFNRYDDLAQLWQKQRGYTLADRQAILHRQKEIMNQCLPTYKCLQEKGHIEITTTPFYHPILPLLIDSESARVAMPHIKLPVQRFAHPEDAKEQLIRGISHYEKVFDCKPQGIWPSEQSISPATLALLRDCGVRWAISSEGNLARSLGISFERDEYGHIINPHQLCRIYSYEGVAMLFRHLTLSDMIGFDYARWDTESAVNDIITRLNDIHQRCQAENVPFPIVTIALDGENCWESYINDGHDFLNALYKRMSDSPQFNVCRVCDYLDHIEATSISPLNYLHSGSWIYDNFHIWIGDPVKNAAWANLKQTRNDLEAFAQHGTYQDLTLQAAWEEIYIAEGSDWFWWFGEPHNSGQDDKFDEQFRHHLANVYKILGKPVPDRLEVPLSVISTKASLAATTPMTPSLTGSSESMAEWINGGQLRTTHGAMHQSNQLLQKIWYCSNTTHAFFRFEMNPSLLSGEHHIDLYACTPGKLRYNSPVRLKFQSHITSETQRYLYGYELSIRKLQTKAPHIFCGEAIANHLWVNRPDILIVTAMDDVLDVAVPFDVFGTRPGEYLQFGVAVAVNGVLESFKPEYNLLSVHRFSDVEAHGPINEHFQRGGLGAAIS